MNPKVDFYFNKEKKWQQEIEKLRSLLLSHTGTGNGLNEELKWGTPCYTISSGKSKKGTNIVLIHTFKEYCALLFFKGALLKDPKHILIQQTENVQLPRQMRFTSLGEIKKLEPVIKAYVFEAMELERSGAAAIASKSIIKKTEEYPVAEEFSVKLKAMPRLKTAFNNLTPGRQRGYLLHFSAPKQSATRAARVEKCIPMILKGKGLNDI